MSTGTIISSPENQGRYSSGTYDGNTQCISSSFVSVKNVIESVERTNDVIIEQYEWVVESQKWVWVRDVVHNGGVSIRTFDVNYNEIGTAKYVSKGTPVNFTADNLAPVVNFIVTFEIDSSQVVNANVHPMSPEEPPENPDVRKLYYCLKNPIDIEYVYHEWIIGDSPHSHYEDAEIFEPDYPTDSMPAAMWRVDPSHNNNRPYNELMRGVPFINLYPELRENVIRVYDKNEPQSGFTSNGLAILHPTSCVSIHNDDRWDITLRHPIDQWGKWRNLLVVNVLKVDGQLFRIKRQKPYIDSSGRYIEVEAKHITTDLADESCFDFEFAGGTPTQFISEARAHLYPSTGYDPPYNFSISAHGDTTLPPDKFAPASLLALLIGLDNSLLNRLGGELYRDNFELVISPRMAYAKDDAFNLRYSLDMVEISQEVDYSDFCTLIHCYDNWGGFWSASYAGTIWWAVHHQIVKVAKFNYAEYDGSFERLMADGQSLADKCFVPKVTYKIKMAALKNDPKYKDFLNLQNYRYGDSGTIYCPELDITTKQKIVEIERNELTGEIISMTLGNMQSSVTRPTYLGSTLTSGHSAEDKANAAMQEEMRRLRLAQARTWFGIRPYTWAETKTYKWEEYR